MSDERCFVCDAPKDFAHGSAGYVGPRTVGRLIHLCHPNDPSLPDCYTLFIRG